MRHRAPASAAVLAAILVGCTTPTPPASVPPTSAATSAATAMAAPTTASPTTAAPSYPFTVETLPRFDGSTANIPLISMVIQRLTGLSEVEADNLVSVTTTPGAYRALMDGSADLLLVYEADKGLQAEIEDSGTELEFHPIGRDGLVFFTNEANPVDSLTTAQYRDIYTGKVTNWKQVGGKDAEIIAYQRPEPAGSQALLRKFVVGDAAMAPAPSERITADMGGIIEGVASYNNTGNALGYNVFYYLSAMYEVDGIKALAVADVMPTKQTIGDGSYPYVNDFFAVVRADEPAGSPARRVLEWLLTPEGRQAVIDAGYVPARV